MEAVEPDRLDRQVDDGGALATGVGASKEVILAAKGNTARGLLGGVCYRSPGNRRGVAQLSRHARA